MALDEYDVCQFDDEGQFHFGATSRHTAATLFHLCRHMDHLDCLQSCVLNPTQKVHTVLSKRLNLLIRMSDKIAQVFYAIFGAIENVGVENAIRSEMQGWKIQ